MKVSEFLLDINEMILNKLKDDTTEFVTIGSIERKCNFNENELRHKIKRNSILKPYDVERLETLYEIDLVNMTMKFK